MLTGLSFWCLQLCVAATAWRLKGKRHRGRERDSRQRRATRPAPAIVSLWVMGRSTASSLENGPRLRQLPYCVASAGQDIQAHLRVLPAQHDALCSTGESRQNCGLHSIPGALGQLRIVRYSATDARGTQRVNWLVTACRSPTTCWDVEINSRIDMASPIDPLDGALCFPTDVVGRETG